MTDSKTYVIARFACAMTGFQSAPHRFSEPGTAEIGMRRALEALDSVRAARTTDRETVICAVVGKIQNSPPLAPVRHPALRAALTCAAEIFVDEVWPVVFKSRQPSDKARSHATHIYRLAFEHAHQLRKSDETVFPF